MHETANAILHYDPPLSEATGETLLRGWFVPKPGGHFTDLRVRAGARLLPAVYGLPRRDLAAYFKSERPCLLAGFTVSLRLPPGSHTLTLEACSIRGTWETIDSVEREVPPLPAPAPAAGGGPIDAFALTELLRVLLHRLADGQTSARAAAEAVIRDTAEDHHLQFPPRPFHGHLDQPQIWSRTLFGRTPLTGWIFHESRPIKRVLATTDLLSLQPLKYGRETPFLIQRPAAPPHAAHAGYDGFLDLPAQLPPPVSVRVYAEMDDGEWHLGSVVRFTATDHEFAKQPCVAFSPLTFWRVWRALIAAIRDRGWSLPTGTAYRQAIHLAWQDYSARAPRGLSLPPARASSRGTPASSGRVMLITHNLGHEGAPLFLLEYARRLREAGADLSVLSIRDGPLRADFEALGAAVTLLDPGALDLTAGAGKLRAGLQDLARRPEVQRAGLVVANTLSCWWGVHLARQAGKPVLFYIHESTTPRVFFQALHPPPDALALVEESFRLADRVSFLTGASRRYYDPLADGSNYCLNPGWIDLTRVDAFRSAHARESLRGELGIAPERRLVVNVGTVCERKGQHLFAAAVELLWRTAPALAASADFLMIGGRDTPYDRELADLVSTLGRPNLRTLPETATVYPYYGAADLFVCSSYEESFPRVVLEAMAFAVPIASTAVHGIPEIARDGREALLVPPGDSAALGAAMHRLLASPEEGRQLAAAARQRVAAEFDSARVLPRHLALAGQFTSIRIQ